MIASYFTGKAVKLFLQTYWKHLAILALVLFVLWASATYKQSLIDRGTRVCETKILTLQNEHLLETSRENEKDEQGYERVVTKIIKVPIEGQPNKDCLSDNAINTNKWLRDNYTPPHYSE